MAKDTHVRTRSAARAGRLDASALTDGGVLYGRDAGRRVAEAVERELREAAPGSVLVVDLTKVRQASYAALKEMFTVLDLLRTSKLAECYLLFQVDARDEDLLEAVEAAARERRSMLPVVERGGAWLSSGRLTKAERDTLEAVEQSGGLTTKDLQQRFDLLASAASNRLRRLHDLRLVRREERVVPFSGGREFIYTPLVAPQTAARGGRRSTKAAGRKFQKSGARGR
ncbi:MAG TPA: MarR family transcriptional regulator [Pyrinomonadaceae bacterium]|nr:MarR family transcriptional regulator [Pyrinomonadaceae bacterium]